MKYILKQAAEFKKRLVNSDLLLGTRIGIDSLSTAEALSNLPFDWFFIDMEHTEIPEFRLDSFLITLKTKPCLVRVKKNEDVYIKKAMDAGASGVIIPKVSNQLEAKSAVQAFRTAPLGKRGVGLVRSNNFGFDLGDYLERVNANSLLIVQIEDKAGVQNIGSILDVEGVDAVFVGPYDLSINLGAPNEFDSKNFVTSIDKIVSNCKARHIPIGIFEAKKERIKNLNAVGFSFFCISSDISFLIDKARDNIASLKDRV